MRTVLDHLPIEQREALLTMSLLPCSRPVHVGVSLLTKTSSKPLNIWRTFQPLREQARSHYSSSRRIRLMLTRVEVTRKQLVFRIRRNRNRMLFRRPGAQVDQLATV